MKLDQLFEDSYTVPNSRYDPSEDKSEIKKENTRTTRITFNQINKLRRMREVRMLEQKKQHEFFQLIYNQPPPQQ